MAKRTLNAAIVGVGAIGSQWDEDIPAERRKRAPITHASAFEALPSCRLLALCDLQRERLQAASAVRAPVHGFLDPDDMLSSVGEQIDLLVLATPPGRRQQLFAKLAGYARPPLIVCEKPVAADMDEAKSLMRISREAGLSVLVPFLRRWVPACQEARRLVSSGALGPIQKVTATYGKGITNNGSHLFDLLIWLFGTPRGIRATDVASDDRLQGNDPTIGCEVEFSDSNGGTSFLAHVLATDHRAWTAFECDVMGRDGRIRLTDRCNKLELYTAAADPQYPGYVVLQHGAVGTTATEEAGSPFAAMYVECAQRLSPDVGGGGSMAGATLRDALLAQAACAAVMQSYKHGFTTLDFAPFVKEWIDE